MLLHPDDEAAKFKIEYDNNLNTISVTRVRSCVQVIFSFNYAMRWKCHSDPVQDTFDSLRPSDAYMRH